MRTISVFVPALLLAGLAGAQTPPGSQQRDLKLEKIEPPKPPSNAPAQSYAVIVGVAAYPNLAANLQLRFSERDAQSIHTALISPEGGNFKAENVKVLTGAKATLAGIRDAVGKWLPSVAKGDDRVVIYFAGHGFIYEGKAYLAPYDFSMKNVTGTGFPMNELSADIGGKIHAKWKVLMTDACHSGAISPEDSENLNHELGSLTQSLFSLTASREQEVSFESPELEGGHGVFTYYVVKGLEGEADANHDGIVTADELAEYVHTQVREATKGAQNPTSDRSVYDKNMWLSFIPANVTPGTAPAPQFGSMAITVNMDDTEVFVDSKSVGIVAKGKPFTLPGLTPGQHAVKGVHQGYEPDGPREETVYPGTESTVNIKILIPRRRSKPAEEALDKGITFYQKGYAENYKKAAEQFEKAFQMDPTYSQAAYYLGLTYNALFDEDKAQQYFKKAIEIDPDYKEAHAAYAGMLLDIGDVDEAIRQINTVLTLQPDHPQALTMLAQADRFKGLWAPSIEAAQKAIALAPKSAEPHLWLGDSLRLSGKLAEAGAEYDQYIKLSDFDSKLGGQLNYYVLGSLFGIGRKKRAAEQDIWKDLRSLAYFGICDCQYLSKQYDSAIVACQRSLSYSHDDPFAHFDLGMAFLHKADAAGSLADLDPALQHLKQVIAINPDIDQAKTAQKNIAVIQKALGQ
ncbi:MAG TPA: tetratricopeptide repeat protein [Bryobacteraceae bacterium]|jgi:tetratricopeptide (TPR) repeat protein|nr:tetratricopeptide repeat protein [Bryobacteraceae bacterium]